MNSFTMLQSWFESAAKTSEAWHLEKIDKTTLIAFLVLVIAWSMIRPGMIRDYDNRRLPHNTTARLFLTSGYCVIFLAMSMMFVFVDGAADHLGKFYPTLQGVLGVFDQPPFLAFVTLGILQQFAFFRDIERTAIVWLHSRRQLYEDQGALAQHLDAGPFEPSAAEQRKNRDSVRQHGIYLTESSFDNPGLVGFNKWRKTATLLRFTREWNSDEAERVLTDEEMDQLRDLETAHQRKTELAVNIIKMVNEAQQGGEASKALAAMLKLLGDTPHVDRASVAAAEARAKMILTGSSDGVSEKPVRLTNEQLKSHLSQIERYFDVEYQILLEQVSEMAARSVLAGGDRGAGRLEQLRTAGVEGLGRLQRYDLNHVLWTGLAVCLFGFLIMYIGQRTNMSPGQAEALARFALSMSVASLIGAIIGSRRRYARSTETPWSVYIAGGLGAGAIFILISAAWNLIKHAMGVAPSAGLRVLTTYQLLPWALLPCAVAMAVARLARWEHWPKLPLFAGHRDIYVRCGDGLSVSIAVYVAYCLAIALHPLLGIDVPPRVQAMMDLKTNLLPIPINWPVQALGFMIGCFVVRDVRWAADSTIIEKADARQHGQANDNEPGEPKGSSSQAAA